MKAPPQGQQAVAANHPLNKPPEDYWARAIAGQGVGAGGGVGLVLPVAMSNTVGASYMTASSVSR